MLNLFQRLLTLCFCVLCFVFCVIYYNIFGNDKEIEKNVTIFQEKKKNLYHFIFS